MSTVNSREATCDVTVIVPCRNGAAYLDIMFQSVAAQTMRPRRRILCDDGSTDGSAALARAAGWEVMPTGGDQHAGKGIASARNTGIASVDTEYVAFLDADDWWTPEHLADCTALLAEAPDAVLAFGSHKRTDSTSVHPVPSSVPHRVAYSPLPGLLASNYVPVSAVVARSSDVRAVGGFRDVMGVEDYELWLRLAHRGSFVFRSALSLHYRVHAGQISTRTEHMGEQALRVRRDALEALRRRADGAPLDQQTLDAAAAGWDETLDHLWYWGHVETHDTWVARFVETFGYLPKHIAARASTLGQLKLIGRRISRGVSRRASQG